MTVTRLTAKQEAFLRIAEREESGPFDDDYANEGMVADERWRDIRRPRLVLNALLDKGLVRLVEWWDEEVGYIFALTDEGRAALAELATKERGTNG